MCFKIFVRGFKRTFRLIIVVCFEKLFVSTRSGRRWRREGEEVSDLSLFATRGVLIAEVLHKISLIVSYGGTRIFRHSVIIQGKRAERLIKVLVLVWVILVPVGAATGPLVGSTPH
jgi:hypothetical protein